LRKNLGFQTRLKLGHSKIGALDVNDFPWQQAMEKLVNHWIFTAFLGNGFFGLKPKFGEKYADIHGSTYDMNDYF